MDHRHDKLSDAALVALTLAGEHEAFEPLLLRYYASVLRLCTRLLGPSPEAQDIAQEAALSAFLNLARLEDPARFGAWLHAIAANLSRMALRRRRPLSLDALDDGSPLVVLWAAGPPLPDEVQASRELHDAIVAALNKLSAVNREAVIGYYLEGYSYAELAALLGVPISTLKGRLFFGRRQLRQALKPLAPTVLTPDRKQEKEKRMHTPELVTMALDSVRINTENQHRVVMLREGTSARYLPIWIGPFEADAIKQALEGQPPPRPQTHDLALQLLEVLEATVQHIVISKITDNTFFAEIVLTHAGQTYQIDARPSDGLALAVRNGAPIFAARAVLDEAGVSFATEEEGLAIMKQQAAAATYLVMAPTSAATQLAAETRQRIEARLQALLDANLAHGAVLLEPTGKPVMALGSGIASPHLDAPPTELVVDQHIMARLPQGWLLVVQAATEGGNNEVFAQVREAAREIEGWLGKAQEGQEIRD